MEKVNSPACASLGDAASQEKKETALRAAKRGQDERCMYGESTRRVFRLENHIEQMNKLIASWFGIGYFKGGGTYASIVTCGLIYLLWQSPVLNNNWYLVLITILITLIGIYVGNQVEPDWGKDSYRVVIDEVAGMLITMLFIPANNYYLLAGLILFRFFDMVKPLFIRRLEALPGGTGVMMDDVLAGIYANILLQVALLLHW